MSRLVAANIVTGFLGSGKTTLLKHVLAKGLGGRRVAVIVNDLGDIDVDGVVLRGIDVDRLVELPSGCVCCTVGSRFALAVQEIVDTVEPHLIVIETSGVAEPGPVMSELALVGVKTDAVIATVDAERVEGCCGSSVAAVRQIEQADFIVINKTDLVSARGVDRVARFLRRLNPRALQIPTTFGQVETNLLFATGTAAYWASGPGVGNDRRGMHLAEDGITAFSFRRRGVIVRERFEALLTDLPPEIYRAKGVVRFAREGWSSVFNYTCGRSRVDWLAPADGEEFDNRAVIIGWNLRRVQDAIVKRLEGCLERLGGDAAMLGTQR